MRFSLLPLCISRLCISLLCASAARAQGLHDILLPAHPQVRLYRHASDSQATQSNPRLSHTRPGALSCCRQEILGHCRRHYGDLRLGRGRHQLLRRTVGVENCAGLLMIPSKACKALNSVLTDF
jgi:hypothetical protein